MDGMTRYWFKRRRFGFGWTPATREGWLTLGLYLAAVLGGAIVLGAFTTDPPGWTVAVYLLIVLVLTIVFFAIAISKGPKPKWRWGRHPSDNPHEDF